VKTSLYYARLNRRFAVPPVRVRRVRALLFPQFVSAQKWKHKRMNTISCLSAITTLGVFTFAATAQSWLTNGLVAYFPLNGNAVEATGKGINGVLYNVIATTNRFGQPSSALYFEPTNQSYIDFGSPSSLQFAGDFTVSAWVNFTGGTLNPRVFSYGADSGYELLTGEASGNRHFGMNIGGVKFNSGPTSPPGVWHFVAAQLAGSVASIFVDGAFIGTVTNAAAPTFSGDLNFGRKSLGGFDNYWGGTINGVRFYNRALSLNELAQLYAFESAPTQTAVGAAAVTNGFVVGVSVLYGGVGYTNAPLVRFIGGGGTGAGAYAVVSNGVVTSITVTNAGYGYTNAPLVVIAPPFIPTPVLGIAPMSFLTFSNLTVSGNYQMQQSLAWYWTNQPINFTATKGLYTQMVAGVVGSGNFRLALNPVPAQAFATPDVVYGFVVHATVTSGGSGYVTSPAVNIVGKGGTNATAVSTISGGVVTNITITSAGIGYPTTTTIEIAPPPAAAVFPTVQPVMRVDSANLAPYDDYQIQFMPTIGGTWGNWNGGLFTPTAVTNSRYLFITNNTGFFRLLQQP